MPLAIFGIGNTALNLVATIVVLVLVAIWVALIAFTFTDARRRISDPFLVGCATAASLFPFVGTLVYSILRPPEFLEDVRERETDIRESEIRLRHLEHSSCHKCGSPVESDFIRCPSCRTRLKSPCPQCSRPVGLEWRVCPYCEKALVKARRASRGSKEAGRSGSTGSRAPVRPTDGRTARREPPSPSGDIGVDRARSDSRDGGEPAGDEAASGREGKARTRRRIAVDPEVAPRSDSEPTVAAEPDREAIKRGRKN